MNHYPGDDTEAIADDKSIPVQEKLVHCIVTMAGSGLKSAQKEVTVPTFAPSTGGLNDKF
jgi:hypothetical protein